MAIVCKRSGREYDVTLFQFGRSIKCDCGNIIDLKKIRPLDRSGKSKVLLHICCGVCASYVVKRLKEEGFEVRGFFYNPNIHPLKEYKRRLGVAKEVSRILKFPLIEGPYDKDNWFRLTEALKDEPEGGARCEVCFRMRLERSYKRARELGMRFFATTLTVSPYKKASVINRIGKELSREGFLERDFKKQDGFKKTMEFAKGFGLYRQDYCGCVYSMGRK